MTTAAHSFSLELSSDNSSYVVCDGLTSCKLNSKIDLLDATNSKDTNFRKRIVGLKDFSLAVAGNFKVDATAQGLLRSLMLAGSLVYFKFKVDGTNGYSAKTTAGGTYSEGFEIDASVEGIVKFSGTLQGNQALEDEGTPD